MRRSHAQSAVAIALLQDPPEAKRWGYEIASKAGVLSGTLYPILRRWLAAGWLVDGWEDAAVAHADGRPPRRYYQLTDEGMREIGGLAERARADPVVAVWRVAT